MQPALFEHNGLAWRNFNHFDHAHRCDIVYDLAFVDMRHGIALGTYTDDLLRFGTRICEHHIGGVHRRTRRSEGNISIPDSQVMRKARGGER